MLRSSLVYLGALAALHGPCGGRVQASEPVAGGGAGENGDAGTGSGISSEGGSTGATGSGATTVVTLASGPVWGMALDSTNVYWTTGGDPTGGFVLKVPKAGGGVTTLASGDRLSGIAVDANSVYWIAGSADASNPASGAVMRVPVGGGAVSTLAVGPVSPSHIAVDDTSVYWTEQMEGAVMKLPLTGGTPTTLAAGVSPWNIALDATSVYWTSLMDGVMKAPKAGGSSSRVSLPAPTVPTSGLAVNATHVYWAVWMPPSLSTIPVQGGTQTVLYAETPSTAPGPLAIDGTSAYWADMSNAVYSGPLGGGAVATLATGQSEVIAIAVDDTSLYWMVNGYPGPGQGSIVKRTPK
ncbi:MAG TPA: hypothetical protein VMW56_21830 [Candidatus Margulisiibacteriota bacterium]|nr:hypothetical protein [Candidatus Margulisiibacteriota bacterium]